MRRSNRSTLGVATCFVSLLFAIVAGSGEPDPNVGEDRWPRLDSQIELASGPSAHITGTDPGAPRPLVLWFWDGSRFSRIATTRSDQRGRFDFGSLPIPSSGTFLHVSLRGAPPEPARLLRLEPPLPAPVLVSGGLDIASRGEIVLAPAIPRGEIRVHDARTRILLLRESVDPVDRGRITLDLSEHLARPWPASLSIEQVLDDGRRSARLVLEVAE